MLVNHLAFVAMHALHSPMVAHNLRRAGYEMLTQSQHPLVLDFAVAPSSSTHSSSLVAALTEDGGFRLLTLCNSTVRVTEISPAIIQLVYLLSNPGRLMNY